MLKISAFAHLAGTTRRTLLFYNQKGLFKPTFVDDNGYRYYSEDQLYQFEFISGLRKLGLSIDEIKEILNDDGETALESRLLEYRTELQRKIKRLQSIDLLLSQFTDAYDNSLDDLPLNVVTIRTQGPYEYWCTDLEVDCEPADIANLYAEFVRDLGELAAMAPGRSGFVTDLKLGDPENYDNASFRIIRERGTRQSKELVTSIRQDPGRYLSIKVKNTREGIVAGLKALKDKALENGFNLSGNLWQINVDRRFVKNASSEEGILQYLIIE